MRAGTGSPHAKKNLKVQNAPMFPLLKHPPPPLSQILMWKNGPSGAFSDLVSPRKVQTLALALPCLLFPSTLSYAALSLTLLFLLYFTWLVVLTAHTYLLTYLLDYLLACLLYFTYCTLLTWLVVLTAHTYLLTCLLDYLLACLLYFTYCTLLTWLVVLTAHTYLLTYLLAYLLACVLTLLSLLTYLLTSLLT